MRLLTDEGSKWSYPSEYLFSRLRGRFDSGLNYIRREPPEAIRQYIEQEHKWVYLQMNSGLRRMLWSFFFYREIRRIFEWLRLGDITTQLESSLLSEEIKEIFLKTSDTVVRIERLETVLLAVSGNFKGLMDAFKSGGLKKFEEALMNSFLSTISGYVTYHSLTEFFRYIIDFRNLMSLYKYRRWKLEKVPLILLGGNMGSKELEKAFSSGDISKVCQLSSRLLNIDIDDPSELEVGFYVGLRRILKRRYITNPNEPILIPYYLWNLYVEYLLRGT